MKLPPQTPSRAADDLVPLINVVFLLLIFFLLAGTLMPAPAAPVRYIEGAGEAAPQIPADAVYVDRAGVIYLKGGPASPEALTARLAEARGKAGPLPLVLDRALAMETVQPVLARLSEAGITRVEIVTLRGSAR
ncbi:biopolymer transporter ExbD [Afifella sp. IM 167]|uniref:ExbD/TolR family protein n=1 Tax=Afifella sp. IM 167 TaxID=2033586 RepID=UPI001CCA56BD|nr:biopolymer transporter ExbD [Afifella sp. IM 167]